MILDDLEKSIQDARKTANEIKEEKLKERIVALEVKYRDLENRLRPFLHLLERRQ